MNYSAERIAAAVSAIGPDIQRAVSSRMSVPLSEGNLWRELACCVLSSQVPYELALAYAERLYELELLPAISLGNRKLAPRIENALRSPVDVGGAVRLYRFPSTKAAQLASARDSVVQTSGSLAELLANFADGATAREWLIANVSGLGPKQASMFLRNVGLSYELAVLDRHVLAYMKLQSLLETVFSPSRLAAYIQVERSLTLHAAALGMRVGMLDWAIWVVMRVVRRRGACA